MCWGYLNTTKSEQSIATENLPPLLVGVGIMVAHNPLHRSQRAGLPHWALTLGTDVQAKIGICMHDSRQGKP